MNKIKNSSVLYMLAMITLVITLSDLYNLIILSAVAFWLGFHEHRFERIEVLVRNGVAATAVLVVKRISKGDDK